MIEIKHSLNFVTELDETHPIGIKLMRLPEEMRIAMLESMLKEFFLPVIAPALEEVNKNGSYAILRVVK